LLLSFANPIIAIINVAIKPTTIPNLAQPLGDMLIEAPEPP
jgi:hypothetical protein